MDLKQLIKDTVKEMVEDGDIEIKVDDSGQLYLEIAKPWEDEDDFDDENPQEIEEDSSEDEDEDE